MNVDNIEIKPKEVDFNKMVEEELAKLGDNPNMDTQATPNKPKINIGSRMIFITAPVV